MSDHQIDLRLFRYALAAAEEGSFRRAAISLGVQQSSVSKGIGNLEHRVGMPLFVRSTSGVRATPEGEHFLREAALGFDHFRRAIDDLTTSRRDHRKIVVAFNVPFWSFGGVLERFSREQRTVAIEMIEGSSETCSNLVQQRRAEIAIVTGSLTDAALGTLHIREEDLYAVVPASHRLAGLPEVTKADLNEGRLILNSVGCGPEVARLLAHHFALPGLARAPGMQGIGQSDLIEMVRHGLGYTIVVGRPTPSETKGLTFVPLAGRPKAALHATWLEGNRDPSLRQLQAILRSVSNPTAMPA